jgi:hypothetical protein
MARSPRFLDLYGRQEEKQMDLISEINRQRANATGAAYTGEAPTASREDPLRQGLLKDVGGLVRTGVSGLVGGLFSRGSNAASPLRAGMTTDDAILRAQSAGALGSLRPGATSDDAILAGQAAGIFGPPR